MAVGSFLPIGSSKGAIKSIQRGLIPYDSTLSGISNEFPLSAQGSAAYYRDIIINEVDVSKATIKITYHNAYGNTACKTPVPKFLNSTAIRLYETPVTGSNSTTTSYKNNHAFAWEVIEFN